MLKFNYSAFRRNDKWIKSLTAIGSTAALPKWQYDVPDKRNEGLEIKVHITLSS
jgi:hypothetical protein